jgi:hypothetical protein
MSLMPCFNDGQAREEGIIIGRLLAGYGELELAMCACLMIVERAIDSPIRTFFKKRGAEKRIEIGTDSLTQRFTMAGLLPELTEALADLDWCRLIRNQYSHCHWYWTAKEGLCFVNLEELAKQPRKISSVTAGRHPIDLVLLQNQEGYFWYVKECFMHLESAYNVWVHEQAGMAGPPFLFIQSRQKQRNPPCITERRNIRTSRNTDLNGGMLNYRKRKSIGRTVKYEFEVGTPIFVCVNFDGFSAGIFPRYERINTLSIVIRQSCRFHFCPPSGRNPTA